MRAKRATITYWVDKSWLKMPKIVNFGKFLKNWSLRSNSVIKQKMPRKANKHSSLRSQNCEMRLFEWLFQQHRAQQGLCKFREVNKYTWQRQKQLKQREGKKWRRQWIDYALVSPMQFVKLHLTIDHFLPGNLFSLLMEEMKHQHCYFCTFPHTLFKNYLKYRNKNNSNFGILHHFCVIKSDPSGKTTIFGKQPFLAFLINFWPLKL